MILVVLLLGWPGAPAAGRRGLGQRGALEELGLACAAVRSSDGVSYTRCSGQVPSFDGVRLDTDVSLPSRRRQPVPTILMLHGWAGSKRDWQAATKDGGGSARKQRWNNVWFVSKGYAVVNYTARGFHESCGQLDREANCVRGWTHLAERDFEIRDSQHLLGLLVDARVADARRLVAAGGSYGGGQTWLLATALPWRSPAGRRLQLAAAVPQYAWTDLLHALVPNGRATDDREQTSSHEVPLGVAKASYITAFYVGGRTVGRGRYNVVDPLEFHSALDAHYALVQAGEPYDKDIGRRFARTYRNKSAYYATRFSSALRDRRARAVPVLSVQGWTDPLFPAVESLQMYRKLQAAAGDYPLYLMLGDVGHPNARNRASEWLYINRQANRFLERFVLGSRAKPPARVVSFTTRCDRRNRPPRPLSARRWEALARGEIRAIGEASRATTWPGKPAGGPASDPLLNAGRCIRRRSPSLALASNSWTWRVPKGGFTLVGLPEVEVSYALSGADATAVFKLWDVDRRGRETLVDRGVYRLARASGDKSSGKMNLDLFGNAWKFADGHSLRLEVGQADAPFLRPDNLPSAIRWSRVRLRLPIRAASRRTIRAA